MRLGEVRRAGSYFFSRDPARPAPAFTIGPTDRESLEQATEKFENAALFLRLGLTSTLIRHENVFKREEFGNAVFRFHEEGKHVKNGHFQNDR